MLEVVDKELLLRLTRNLRVVLALENLGEGYWEGREDRPPSSASLVAHF